MEEEYHYDRTIPVSRLIKAFDVTTMIEPPSTVDPVDQRFLCVEATLQLLFTDMRLCAARGETYLEELQLDHPLSAVTQQWLGLAEGG